MSLITFTLPAFVSNETPAGSVDGTNQTFHLSQVPAVGGFLILTRNGIVQVAGIDFSITGNAIVFIHVTTGGDILSVTYEVAGQTISFDPNAGSGSGSGTGAGTGTGTGAGTSPGTPGGLWNGEEWNKQMWTKHGTTGTSGPTITETIPGAPGTTPGQFANANQNTASGATNSGLQGGSASGVTGYMPDGLTIMQEACEKAGVDFTDAYTLRSAKRSIDFIQMTWANEGINCWTLDFQTQALTPGVFQYALPADTVDVVTASIRTTTSYGQSDILLARYDFASYLAMVNKLSLGKPTQIFVQRTAIPQAYLWQVPNSIIPYALIYWRLRRIQNTGYATNLPDMPFRFIPALIDGLAWQMAQKKKGQKDLILIASLEKNYRDTFRQAQRGDMDRSSLYIQPYTGY